MPASPALSFAVAACRSPPDSVKHLEAEPFISHDLNPIASPEQEHSQSSSNAISTTRLRMQPIKVRHDVEKITSTTLSECGENYHTHHWREVRNDGRHADRKNLLCAPREMARNF
jgi:hypothetical protein